MAPPTPKAFALLVVLLPGVWLAGAALAERLARDRWLARLLTPALGLALWLSAIHIASLLARSFWIGLPVGTLLVAAAGALSWFYPASAPPAAPALPSAPTKQGRPAPRRRQPRPVRQERHAPAPRWMWISALLAMAYLAPAALGWWFHDMLLMTGHLSMTSAIENGPYPPRHLSFPELELRYHYGFNLLAASVASMLRLRVDHAMELVTLLAWGYSWCLAWATGERLVGQRWGGPTAAVVLFGGGMPFFSSARSLAWRLVGFSKVGTDFLNPPVVSYFFQRPWTLGIPLGLATILIVSERDAPASWARSGAIGALLVALSFCQFVLFLSLAGALLVTETLAEWRIAWTRALRPLLLLGTVLFVASRLHGFFAPWPGSVESMLEFRPLSLGGSLAGWASWHLQTFGLLLPLGAVGLFLLARERLLVSLLVAGSLLVLNSFQYRSSWDIVKFGTVASLALSLGASASLRRLFDLRPLALGRTAGALAAPSLLVAGFLFLFVFAFDGSDVTFGSPVLLSRDDEEAVGWLRVNVRPGEIVYRRGTVGLGYAQWGGLPQLRSDRETLSIGVPPRLVDERVRFLQAPVSAPEVFLQQRVRWFVLGPGDEVAARITESWVAERRALVRARFGPLTIVELLGEIPAI